MRTEAEWSARWATMFACASPPPPPVIDFSREMLVIAGVGGYSNGGGSVAIEEAAVDAGGALRVHVTEYRAGSGCVTTQSITWPVAVARVPVTDAPPVFSDEVVVFRCR